MDISIIIPVYNAEKYLRRCVDSVLKSLKNAKVKGEILLINNNSTDKSNEIIKSYEKNYPKIVRAFDCAVPGASAARNFGVRKMKGKYIWFIDADDTISKTAVSDLIEEATKTSADFIMLGADKILEDGKKIYLPAFDPKDNQFKSRFIRRVPGPWEIIIKKSWWDKNKFSFREGIIHEDLELLPALILYTDNIGWVNKPLYTYYFTPGSVLHKNKWDKKYLDIFSALKGLYGRFEKMKALEEYYDEVEWFFIWNLLMDSADDFRKGGKDGRVGYRHSRNLLKEYFPNWRKNHYLNQKKLGGIFKIRVILRYFGIVI